MDETLQKNVNKMMADLYAMNLFLLKLSELLIANGSLNKKEYTIMYNNHNISLKKDKHYNKLLNGE